MDFIVNMACGLANRMFQYSYFLFLKKKGFNVAVDFYRKGKLAHEKVNWEEIFVKADLPQASHSKVFLYGGDSSFLSRFRRRFLPFLTKVVQMPTAFDAFIPSKKDRYVIGVFQNAQMVETVQEEVQNAFVFTPFEDERNLKMMQVIQNSESVGIHVRKGKDYQQRIWYQGTCPLSYYEQAVQLMKQKLENPRFFVFTDNPKWVKENFKNFDYVLVEGNPGAGPGCHYDMQLMSYCSHNIISNSTYSWWSAFLNKNKNKIVIGPKQWFNPNSCMETTSEKTLCSDWIAL